jgi:sugar-specific transcriptional regulator TrmB
MMKDWMFKTLVDLGFKKQDAEVYVFLALNGPKNAKKIADTTLTNKRQIYRILQKLQSREIITATINRTVQYSAVSFDKVLDILIQANMEEANRMEDKKEEIIALWKSNVTKHPLF